jgi:hypothetical protein
MKPPLRARLEQIVREERDESISGAVDRILETLIAASKRGFVARASDWLQQIKDGKEMRF